MLQTGELQADYSWAVVKKDWKPAQMTVNDQPSAILIITSELKVEISKSPCRFTFYDSGGNLINKDDLSKGISWDDQEVRCWKVMPPNEHYYGFGEKANSFDKRDQAMTMWNSDIPAYGSDTDPLYQTIPFFLAFNGGRCHGIFFDNTYRSVFDMGKSSDAYYSFGATGGGMNYYFFYGPDPKKVLNRYTELVGRMPLPPRWALGYQQSRWGYYPEGKVRDIAENFRKRNIPCDVIYLDIDYMGGFRCFTWDSKNFPNPKGMLDDLKKSGFKFVVIIDPGIKQDTAYWVYQQGVAGDHFVKYPDGKPFIGQVWPGNCAFPDFTSEETRKWWGSLYKGLLDVGIKGFWNDMNEPSVFNGPNKTFALDVIHDDIGLHTDHRKSHNVYGMLMGRGTHEGVQSLRPNERPFVLTRASYAGGQRYAAAWTGDNISSWNHLYLALPMCLGLGLSGQPFVGTDIGGFMGDPTGELYARWLQLGVLTPLCRTHSVKGSKDKEPWSYGEKYETINRRSIELRYQLMPYLYTAFYEATQTGLPLMRPLFLDYPDDQKMYDRWTGVETEFLFGNDLLVAPVLEEGRNSRAVYFPRGEWYNFWTNEKISGPASVNVSAPIDTIALFVRAGAIIPMQKILQYVDQSPIDLLTFSIYPSEASSSIYYEDDGISFDFQKGEYRLVKMHCTDNAAVTNFSMSDPQGIYVPPSRSVLLKFNSYETPPKQVLRNGKVVSLAGSEDVLRGSKEGWTYSAAKKVLWVKLPDEGKEEVIRIKK
jgi:alpha-glucosidase